MGKPVLPDSPTDRLGRYFKYAIGEIVLVMIGILLALQVSNWNENRKTRHQEVLLLKSLKLEMEQNANLIDDYLKAKEAIINDITELLTFTNPEYKEKKEDSLEYKLSKTFTIYNFIPEIMVLQSAQNSNSINLIKNQNIKLSLSKWEQSLKILMEYDNFGSEYFNKSFVPMVSSYYPFVNIKYNRSNQGNNNLSKHKPEIEKLFRNRNFENSAFRLRNFNKIRVSYAEDLKTYTQELIQSLKKELSIGN